jgi:hypothetical protein
VRGYLSGNSTYREVELLFDLPVIHARISTCAPLSISPVELQLKDYRQVRSEIHMLFSPVTVKFNFEQRWGSRSGFENSAFQLFSVTR